MTPCNLMRSHVFFLSSYGANLFETNLIRLFVWLRWNGCFLFTSNRLRRLPSTAIFHTFVKSVLAVYAMVRCVYFLPSYQRILFIALMFFSRFNHHLSFHLSLFAYFPLIFIFHVNKIAIRSQFIRNPNEQIFHFT